MYDCECVNECKICFFFEIFFKYIYIKVIFECDCECVIDFFKWRLPLVFKTENFPLYQEWVCVCVYVGGCVFVWDISNGYAY